MADAKPRSKPLAEIGTTGLKRAGGYIAEEFLPKLRGQQGVRIYQEMASNDATAGAVLFAIEQLIKQAEWTAQPVDDSEKAQAEADYAQSLLDDMSYSWIDTLGEIATMFTFGFAPMEVVYKLRRGPDEKDSRYRSSHSDGRYGIRKITLRQQHTVQDWQFDEDGGLTGFTQRDELGNWAVIPIENLLLFRTSKIGNNPEGKSILRHAYRSWFFKKRIEEIEGIGVDRDLAGLPVMHLPPEMMASGDGIAPEIAAAFQSYKDMITKVRRDQQEGIILPAAYDEHGNQLYKFELMSSGGSRQFDTNAIITRYDTRIAMSVLADFILLGSSGSTGSWALSSDKTKLFAQAVGAFLDVITDTLNRYLLPRLWRINGLDPELMPTFIHGDIETPDLTELAGFIGSLAGAGAIRFPDRPLENHLRAAGSLPPAPDEGAEDGADLGTDALATNPALAEAIAGFFGQAGGGKQPAQKPKDEAAQEAAAG